MEPKYRTGFSDMSAVRASESLMQVLRGTTAHYRSHASVTREGEEVLEGFGSRLVRRGDRSQTAGDYGVRTTE